MDSSIVQILLLKMTLARYKVPEANRFQAGAGNDRY